MTAGRYPLTMWTVLCLLAGAQFVTRAGEPAQPVSSSQQPQSTRTAQPPVNPHPPVNPQPPPNPQPPVSSQPTANTPAQMTEADLTLRRRDNKGISVESPKVYDDSLLQQMLRAAEAKLAATQVIDQAGIQTRIGALSGASQRISSIGINVQTPALPSIATTDKGGTSTTIEKETAAINADGKPSSGTERQETVGAPTQDVVTTRPSAAPPPLITPAATTTLPSSFSVSASDVLNEQMQLTYEIANLRLLLEGALSDHVMQVQDRPHVKPRATVGFGITIDAQNRYKDAVAVVEVEVESPGGFTGQETSITALLPREKTYNVAAITDNTMSIGGGVSTAVVGVSGSWLSGHKTYYVTQDQDTVALTFTPKVAGRVGFQWQFRPVLGKSTVRSGLKQTFVQLSFPQTLDVSQLGQATIRTYWLKYDKKKGTVGAVIKDSLREYPTQPITRPRLAVDPFEFNDASLQDLGGGQMLVHLQGRFLSGTYVRIGSTLVREGAANAIFEHFAIKFTASIADLATKQVAIVARDGRERVLTTPGMLLVDGKGVPALLSPKGKSSVTGLDDGNVLLTVDLEEPVTPVAPLFILVIGGRVFGYSDAPIDRQGTRMSATVPLALILANPTVTIRHLFSKKSLTIPIEGLTRLSRSERLILLEQGGNASRLLLYGSRLSTVRVVEPAGVTIANYGRSDDADTLRLLTVPNGVMKVHKQIVLQRSGERPFLLAMPGTAKVPAVKAKERVVVAADAALFEADTTEGLTKVIWRERELDFERLPDGKTIRVHGLKARGVTDSLTTQTLDFVFDVGKASATMEIVSNRVESVAR